MSGRVQDTSGLGSVEAGPDSDSGVRHAFGIQELTVRIAQAAYPAGSQPALHRKLLSRFKAVGNLVGLHWY
eukprot:2333799-Rhodomonas_salina.3